MDWAIEVDLSGDYDLSDGMSTVAFTIDGEKVNKQGDILLSDLLVSIVYDIDSLITSTSLCPMILNIKTVWDLVTVKNTFHSLPISMVFLY